MNNDLKIYPIKPEIIKGLKKKRELHPNLPDPYKGALIALVAPIRSSKSTTWNNLIHNENFYLDLFSEVYVISNTIASDATSRFTYAKFKHTCYEMYDDTIIKNIIKHQKQKISTGDQDTSFCIILDDLLGEFPKTGKRGMEAISLSSRFRHYVKPNSGDPCMMLYSTQRYFDLNRVVRNNATAILLSGNIRSRKEWDNVIDDYADAFGGREKFEEMIKIVQSKPYQWLHLDLTKTPPVARLNFDQQLFPASSEDVKLT
tara:strand:- start:628 stop:1404 length:777 start_codon:yes stop_codon:yes gene_type:complete